MLCYSFLYLLFSLQNGPHLYSHEPTFGPPLSRFPPNAHRMRFFYFWFDLFLLYSAVFPFSCFALSAISLSLLSHTINSLLWLIRSPNKPYFVPAIFCVFCFFFYFLCVAQLFPLLVCNSPTPCLVNSSGCIAQVSINRRVYSLKTLGILGGEDCFNIPLIGPDTVWCNN